MSIIEGALCENFVYLELVRRIRKQEIAGHVPWFAVDKKTSGELDFYVRSRNDNMDYGLEVKRGKNRANTANVLRFIYDFFFGIPLATSDRYL